MLAALAAILIAQPITTLKSSQPGETRNEVLDFYVGPLLEPVSQRIPFAESHVTGLTFRVIAERPGSRPIPIAFRLFDGGDELIAEDLVTVRSSSVSQPVFFGFAPLVSDTAYRVELVAVDPDAKLKVGASVHDRFVPGAMTLPSNPVEGQDLYFTSVVNVTFAEQIANQVRAGSAGYIGGLVGGSVGALAIVLTIGSIWAQRLGDRLHIAAVGALAAVFAGTLLAASAGLPLGDTKTDVGPLGFVLTTLTGPFAAGVLALLVLAAWRPPFRLALALAAQIIGAGAIFGEILVRAEAGSWATSLWIGLVAFAAAVFAFATWHLWLGHRELASLAVIDDTLEPAQRSPAIGTAVRIAARDIASVFDSGVGRTALLQQAAAALLDAAAMILSAVLVFLIASGPGAVDELIGAIAWPVGGVTILLAFHRARTWLQVFHGAHALAAVEDPGLLPKVFMERGGAPDTPRALLSSLATLGPMGGAIQLYTPRALLSSLATLGPMGGAIQLWRAVRASDYMTLAARVALAMGAVLMLTSAVVLWTIPIAELSERSFWTGVASIVLSLLLRTPRLAQLSRRS